MRHAQTPAEQKLWCAIRDRQINGLKFRRQVPHGRYILDFYCAEIRLVIEIDGASHAENHADIERDRFLTSQNIHVIRFWNNEVLANLPGVLERITEISRGRLPQATPAP